MVLYVIIGIIIAVTGYIFVEYNTFIKLNNLVKEAFSTMDVYLKKRWDLIPNLVEIVKGYSKYESHTLENIVKFRGVTYDNMILDDKIKTNNQLAGALKNIFIVIEDYPELKANRNFLSLNSQLSEIENEIANSRKYYNGIVKKLNNKVEMFPSNIIAEIFKFHSLIMFKTDINEKDNVNVDL